MITEHKDLECVGLLETNGPCDNHNNLCLSQKIMTFHVFNDQRQLGIKEVDDYFFLDN